VVVGCTEADTTKPLVAPAEVGTVAGPLPNTAGLEALTGAMDKLEALLRPKEGQSNPAGMSLVPTMCLRRSFGFWLRALGFDEFPCLCRA
jgi:hypothetical protein